MRVPVSSERDAYRIVWASVGLAAVAIAVGALVHPLAGAGVAAAAILAAAAHELRSPNPDRVLGLREAGDTSAGRPSGDSPRVLVVANQTLPGEELRADLSARTDPKPELRVVVPILCSRVKYVMSDIDTELVYAHARLDEMLDWARAAGFAVSGEVCTEGPLTAIEDQLRQYSADEIVISTHPPERSNWLEEGVVERAQAELDIPIRHVIVDLARTGTGAAQPSS